MAAIAANILPNTTHAKGSAANGTLPGSGAAPGDVFAQLLAALSAGTAGATAMPQAALFSTTNTAMPSAAHNFKALHSSSTADAQSQTVSGDAATLAAGTPDATPTPQAAFFGAASRATLSAAHNFKALLSSDTADAQPQTVSGDAATLAVLNATVPKGIKQPSMLLTNSAPAGKPAWGQKSGANGNVTTNATAGKDAAPATDPKSLLAQLVIAPNDTLPAATTPAQKPRLGVPAQAAPDSLQSAPANTNTPAAGQTQAKTQADALANTQAGTQADALAAASARLTDKAAAGIVPNGTTTKPARDTKADANTAAADSVKTQSRSSAGSALAALSNAATHNFSDQKTSNTNVLPVHALDGQKDSNDSANAGSDNQQNNARAQNTQVTPASDARTAAADAASAPSATALQQSAPVTAAAPTDGASIAATNGATQNGPSVQANQTPVSLQVAPASPNAELDTNAFAVTIATKSKDGSRQFDIRLDPVDLGRVDVRLTVDEVGKVQATLSVEKPQTLELLQKDSSHLETALKDAGFDLSQNGLNFSLKGQQQQGGNGNAPSSRGRTLKLTAVAAADATPSTTYLSGVSATDTRLDIRV